MSDPVHRISAERVFEALREVDVPSWHEGDPALPFAISKAIRKGPDLPRRTRPVIFGVALAACVALGVLGAWAWSGLGEHSPEPAPVANHRSHGPSPSHVATIRNASGTVVAKIDGKAFVVSSGETHGLSVGGKVTTAVDSLAELALPSGVLVAVSQSTQLVVSAAGEPEIKVALEMGRVAFEVPKLSGGRKVSVETPDAKVVVRGTRFVVDVAPLDAASGTTVTSVEVSRGSVLVLSNGAESLLAAGDSWSSVAPAPIDLDLGSDHAAEWAGAIAPRSLERGAGVETLTEENRLFQEALDARNAGDRNKAARLLSDLLVRFPKSPVAHEARVERFRALEQAGDHAEAVREARRYLHEYPSGSMAREARALVEAGLRSQQVRP